MIFSMSRIAAPTGEVTIPILLGTRGSWSLRPASKRPSLKSFSLSSSNRIWRRPRPLHLDLVGKEPVFAPLFVEVDPAPCR